MSNAHSDPKDHFDVVRGIMAYAGLASPETEEIFRKNSQHAKSLIDGIIFLYFAKILTKENLTIIANDPTYAKCIAWGLETLHKAALKKETDQPLDRNNINKYIYTENSDKFTHHQKIAAFFIACQEDLKKNLSSPKVIEVLSEIKPPSLGDDLRKILHKMGGYTFMSSNEKNITMGVEIEYSNIPTDCKKLIQSVMDLIQKGWSHPDDGSVKEIGVRTYGGESTTPIISNNKEFSDAMLNIAFLQAMGGQTNSSCGLHVHIGVENIDIPPEFNIKVKDDAIERPYTVYQLEFIKQFLMIYKREEAKFGSIERDHNKYTLPISTDNIKSIKTLSELTKQVNPEGRHYEMNLHAFVKHGTIEIRRFSGSTEEAQIFATASMVASMAKEARTKTNAIFSKADNLDSFYQETKTQRQRELFMLNVKSVNESTLELASEGSVKKPNTVYITLNKDNLIEYEILDKTNKIQTGTIPDNKHFQNIITKLKDNQALDSKETNQLLLEVANQGHALISHRVDKLKASSLPDKIHDENANRHERSGRGIIYGLNAPTYEVLKSKEMSQSSADNELKEPKFHPDPDEKPETPRPK